MNKMQVGLVSVAAALCVLAIAEADDESSAAEAAAPPTVADLAWMTGAWAGPAGHGELEEHWTAPKAGSMQAVVRMTGGGATSMVELIVIEEAAGTLRLHLQQWGPGYRPLPAGAQAMTLVAMGENSVEFAADAPSEHGIAKLRYARDGDTFTIGVVMAAGGVFDLALRAF